MSVFKIIKQTQCQIETKAQVLSICSDLLIQPNFYCLEALGERSALTGEKLSSKKWISSEVKELIPIVESLVPTSIRGVHMFLIEKAPAEVFLEDRTTYPFENMDVGDSFLITDFRKAESARVSAIQFCKRKCKDWKFTQRKMDGGWRIIRIGWRAQKWVLQGPFLGSMIKTLFGQYPWVKTKTPSK